MVVDMAEFSRIQRYEQELNGTAGVTRLQVQIKSIMASGFKDVASSYEDALREFAGDGGIFTFEQPEEAHHVAVAILQASERESEKGRALKIREALRCFRIGIDYGECGRDRQRQLTSVIISRARRLEAGGPAGEIRISTDAYGRLPEPVQRQYGKEELLRGKKHDEPIPAHRFTVVSQASWPRSGKAATRDAAASDKLTRISAGECFVVSPINERDQRIAAVFKGLISAACERLGFEAKRADHIPGTDRVPLITGRLSTAPLVIAYLGNPSPRWNPDVMLEVGFRFATGLPLVLLSELPHKKGRLAVSFTNILPFHLVNKSVLEVPKTPAAAVERLVDAMRVALSEKSSTEWNTLFPIVECHFADFQGEVTLTYASPEAEALFHLGAARGVRISIADRQRFRDRVEPAQLRAYMMEQFELMRRIQAKAMGLDSIFNGGGGELLANIPPARVPLIFKDDPRGANGKPTAYLPQIVRYQIKSGIIHLRTLYLRVSDSLRQDPSGHWICEL
jgi:class 3 adenylate cyclase